MREVVLKNIKEYDLIKENENIVIGVSGGTDSMALMHVLLDIQEDIPFNIIVAHVNHGVRGVEASKDERFVKSVANKLKIPYFSKNVDMVLYGKEMGITAEEAGRELRYGFFREILSNRGGGKIAVAHNLNDQAETLLMRFFRGTGIDGLKGMDFITGDIIRPILNINRDDIEEYISLNNIEIVLDKTNLLPIYTRNKVRLELIPYIEENFNPNILNTLWRMSQISNIDSKFLEEYSQKRYNYMLKVESKNSVVLHGNLFKKESPSIQQRIVRNSLQKIHGSLQGFSEQHISSITDLFNLALTGKKLNLPNNIIARVNYEELILEINRLEETMPYNLKLNLGYNEFDELDYIIRLNMVTKEQSKKDLKNKGTNIFDYDKIKGNLYVRNRKPGDRFVPYGMKGSKKIKDYFIDEKIPKDIRDEIPLIVDDENILYVLGYRTSELYKVTEDTKNFLSIEYESKGIREEYNGRFY